MFTTVSFVVRTSQKAADIREMIAPRTDVSSAFATCAPAMRQSPVATVKRVLDGMSATKLNVLHWHLTDDSSFPVQSTEYPQLAARDAIHPGLVYSPTDLRSVVAHAAARGVRVTE